MQRTSDSKSHKCREKVSIPVSEKSACTHPTTVPRIPVALRKSKPPFTEAVIVTSLNDHVMAPVIQNPVLPGWGLSQGSVTTRDWPAPFPTALCKNIGGKATGPFTAVLQLDNNFDANTISVPSLNPSDQITITWTYGTDYLKEVTIWRVISIIRESLLKATKQTMRFILD